MFLVQEESKRGLFHFSQKFSAFPNGQGDEGGDGDDSDPPAPTGDNN